MNKLTYALINGLVFPVAPIAVIVLICGMCADLWHASYYDPQHTDGDNFPLLAVLVIPVTLIGASLSLATLTALNRWVVSRYRPRAWWRLATGVVRVALVAVSSLLFLTSSEFFMGDSSGVFRHWQVAVAWLAFGVALVAFWVQQYRRLRG